MSSTPRIRDETVDARPVLHLRGEIPTEPGVAEAGDERGRSLARIGRFLVLERVGAGGMGIVYAAYDPDLDRRVAIKLWRHDQHGDRRDALLTEARAMARVTHPNVVTVHEVGLHDGQVYLAMEFVRGQSLRRWLAQPRQWPDVLRVFIDAGRGLVAVHQAGLVHRDFKPDNVLLGDDGRVQVTDFGIAGDNPGAGAPARRAPLRPDGTDRLVGTPGFMAPEQYLGGVVDGRTDQFAFCVALYTALTGARPFAGDNLVAMFEAIERGAVEPPPRGLAVPGRVLEAVRRGLAADPAARWPDLEGLLQALAVAVQPRSRRTLAWLGAGAVAGAVALLATRGEPRCDDGRAAMAAIWSDDVAGALAAGFAAAAPGYGSEAWVAIAPELERRQAAWVDTRAWACTVPDAVARQLHTACLEQQRVQLAALLDVLAQPDATTVQHAAAAVAQLPDPEQCSDLTKLRPHVALPSDPATLARIEQVRAELARARQLYELARYDDALASVRGSLADADAVDHAPLRAEALLLRAELESATGDEQQAQGSLRAAYGQARRADDFEHAHAAAEALARSLGIRERRFESARPWREIAVTEGGLAGIEGPVDVLDADLAYEEGRYADAVEQLEALLERARARGEPAAQVRALQQALAAALGGVGRYHDALALQQQLLELAMRSRGEHHPDVAEVWMGIGSTQGMLHRSEAAVESYGRALAIRERALGTEHPLVAMTLSDLAAERAELGALEQAQADCTRALAIFERSLGPDHPDTAACLNVLAMVHWDRDWAATAEYLARAVAVTRPALGDHPTVAALLNNLAGAETKLGRGSQAIAHYREAVAIRERAVGHDDPLLAYPLKGLGAELRRAGELDDARQVLERAVARFEGSDGRDRGDYGNALLELALTHAAQGRPAVARGLVERALVELRADDKSPLPGSIAQAQAWLRDHPQPP